MIYVLYGLDSYLINYNVKKIVKGDDKEYFDLEVKINVMIADINKIIAESIKDVLI